MAKAPRPPAAPTRRPGRGWLMLVRAVIVIGIVAALLWKPPVGIALAAMGLIYLIFRHVDLDATTILTVYLVLLTLVPAGYVVPALGAAGTPEAIVSLGCLYWWTLEHTAPRSTTRLDISRGSLQPVRVALAFFLLTTLIAFVVAFARPLTSVEANGAARVAIRFSGLVGVGLLASDGIRSRERLGVLLNRTLNLVAIMAIVACTQFFTDFDPVTRWRIPGLELNQDLSAVATRSVVNRVAATTLHPIEFGAIVAIMLPLALHTAIYAERKYRTRRWIRFGLVALALPLSVSRTAIVIAAVVVLMMWPAWTWARRARFVVGALVFLVAVRAVVQGLLGTIASLFTEIGDDPSTTGRTEDYNRVWEYFNERPWFGRGLGTFDPGQYFFLDNQALMTLITGGIIGIVGLVILIITAATSARQVFWHGPDEQARHLGAALAAAIVGGFFGFFTFDALGFNIFAGLLFLLIGMAGAAWRLDVATTGRLYTNPRRSHLAEESQTVDA